MEPVTTTEVLSVTGGAQVGALPPSFCGITTDTRSISTGELFVALRGENHDAHEFLASAAEAGAAAAVVSKEPEGRAPLPLIVVKDTSVALLALAAFHRKRLRARVIAVTGTNGKTTTKDLIRAALGARNKVVASPKSFNNFVGVPITLFLADATTDFVVMEVGTNSVGEIETLAKVIQPDVAVITNVAAAHLEGLGDVDGVRKEKGALLDHVRAGGVSVLNRDDASYDALSARAAKGPSARVVGCGVRKRADYIATMPFCDLDRVAFHLNGRARVRVPLLGCHNLYNVLMALAVAVECGVDEERAAVALKDFVGPPMRLKKHVRGRRLVIDDTYNANPGSMTAAAKTFAALAVSGRKVLVLGDMLELGDGSAALHREVGRGLSCGEFDLIAAVGDLAPCILDGARESGIREEALVHYPTTEACARDLPGRLLPDDAVLVKGSRRMSLERVVERVLNATRPPNADAGAENE